MKDPSSARWWHIAKPLVTGLGIAVVLGLAWLGVRTPTRAGLGYHVVAGRTGAPAVVLLHGYGAPGSDLVPLAERLAAALEGTRVIALEAPHDVGLGRAWFRRPFERAPAADRVARFVDALIEEGTPRGRIVLAGFSQGAAIASDVSARTPGLAGTALLSGDHSTPGPLTGSLFVSHGRADPVLPFGAAARRVEVYRETADVTFVPFGGGHAIGPAEDALTRWLAAVLTVPPRPLGSVAVKPLHRIEASCCSRRACAFTG